ncbi:alpha-glycosidase [Paenibacillus sp. FSL R5-0766]|uniref:alpha-glycosidase n=1 Tax=unclassified Paenibacillus TaxID=185978 RepID=UPI00096E555F|nr:alpha-glycosidase [Paenibacillus sp. FSL R5-0765]OMF63519.1 alpha-glycosidase [Paenibacillus sp. FSL R5-0765]
MILEAIYHRPKLNWSYAYDRSTMHLRLRSKRGDLDAVIAITGDKYAWDRTITHIPMHIFARDEMFDYWEAETSPPYRRLRYGFQLIQGEESVWMTERGFEQALPDHPLEFFDFPFMNPVDIFEPPAWVKDAVFYQIFPERYANGDPSISPKNAKPWGGEPTPVNFFGGDLQGVLDHLDHISQLGINAIYFCPLFEATTNHKYNTGDYMKVDPHFGTNEQFKAFVDACHQRGIRVVLDAVFNHSGREFPPFIDVMKNGASSPYADWFYIKDWPPRVEDGIPTYDTFAFEPLMPKLNTEHPEVKAYLLEVGRFWIEEMDIDGWRLDVANEVDHQFWREFRQTVKAIKPDAYLLGEIWHDSLMWLQGDQFDAVMNYPFTNSVLDYTVHGKLDGLGFANEIGKLLAAYSQPVTEAAFNLLGSHDTPRLLSLCDGDERKMKLAVTLLLTYPGVPCIYYGDEVGLDGGYDPGCRKCMEWDETKQNRELLEFFTRTISLRKQHPALRSTELKIVYAKAGDPCLAIERLDSQTGERMLLVLNAGDEPCTLELPLADRNVWRNLFTSNTVEARQNKLTLDLEAYGFSLMQLEVKQPAEA